MAKFKLDRGLFVAIAALAVLGTAIGWRFMYDGGSDAAHGEPVEGISSVSSLDELEQAAKAEPGNAQGWQRYGLALFQAGRFDEAASAYESATRADDKSAVLWSSLGEARVMASRDEPLPAAALAAFERALALDSGDPRARYFLAVKKDLAGDHDGAIADWLALLADTEPGAPWETDLVRTIQQVAAINQIDVEDRLAGAAGARDLLPASAMAAPGAELRGPSQQQMQAAAALTPSQQQDMAEGMVSRLAERLKSEPGDVDGWVMLMRSYRQLGRDGAATRARDDAIAANPQAREQIEKAAQSLGVR